MTTKKRPSAAPLSGVYQDEGIRLFKVCLEWITAQVIEIHAGKRESVDPVLDAVCNSAAGDPEAEARCHAFMHAILISDTPNAIPPWLVAWQRTHHARGGVGWSPGIGNDIAKKAGLVVALKVARYEHEHGKSVYKAAQIAESVVCDTRMKVKADTIMRHLKRELAQVAEC